MTGSVAFSKEVHEIAKCLIAGPITEIVAFGFTELILRTYLSELEKQAVNAASIHNAQTNRYAILALKKTLGDI